MNNGKLPCYGITARALQILTGSKETEHTINPAWFNWTHDGVSRLTVVNAETAGRWCKNSVAAGYDCVYVGSIDDDFCIDDLDDLEDGIGYSIVVPSGEACETNRSLLKELREVDETIDLLWGGIQTGGGHRLKNLALRTSPLSSGALTVKGYLNG